MLPVACIRHIVNMDDDALPTRARRRRRLLIDACVQQPHAVGHSPSGQ